MSEASFSAIFREAAPYIHYLRGKVVVLAMSTHVLRAENFSLLAQDIALLNSLGVRVVLVHGIRGFLEKEESLADQYNQGYRITDENMMQSIKQYCGAVRLDIEAALGMGFLHAPAHTVKLSVTSGNFISAKPLGVLNGIDMQLTGQVRKIDTESMKACLDRNQLVLVSPVGHSLGGVTYNLSMPDTAAEIAIALKAAKLLFLTRASGIAGENQQIQLNLSANEAMGHMEKYKQHPDAQRMFPSVLHALRNGVHRVQIIDGTIDGNLLKELFTRRGVGTSLAHITFTNIRPAVARDIPDLLQLIEPMVEKGILLPRTYDDIESHIHEFFVAEYDDLLYGCAALKHFADDEKSAEIACLAVSSSGRGRGYGDLLLERIEEEAKKQDIHRLFALTTQTADWFIERGFQETTPDTLPALRLAQYQDNKRRSKVFIKDLLDD
ncbi:MAG: amino-acid N-acetyltransferase [Neisseriaceae bacterium]|nr:amino-acid N-acetyltransferase [Neisseriaceae bacterium]